MNAQHPLERRAISFFLKYNCHGVFVMLFWNVPTMKKKNIAITISIIALLALSYAVKPYLHLRDAQKIVTTVLTLWENNDLTLAMPYWEKEINSPPVYDLIDYKIGKGEISKENGTYFAHFTAILNFPPGNLFPSGEQWIFKLKKLRYGWKITDFRLSEGEIPQ